MHVFRQKEIESDYNTLFVDIYGTKNMGDFIREFQNAFIKAPFAQTARGRKQVNDLFQRIYLQVNFTPDGSINSARIGVTPSQGYSLTLTEMFDFLEKTKKPNLIVFDEFQQIQDYPEPAAAIIRSHVQRMNNTHFIFSGSSRHLLHNMFENSNEPFYRSASSMDLKPIPMPVYVDFAQRLFRQYGKDIDAAAVELTYMLFSGNTYDMQEVMKQAFFITRPSQTATNDTIIEAVNNLLDQREEEFREKMDQIDSEKARRLLFCIANEGLALGLTSAEMIKKYRLDNASSVQNALIYLSDDKRKIITKVGKGGYVLQNRFFEYWLARNNQKLAQKIESAAARFEAETQF